MNLANDWRGLFAAQVRALQAIYPKAHESMLNWAIWSRDLGHIPGKTNSIEDGRGIWDMAAPSTWDDWGDEQELPPLPEEMVRADRVERPPHDIKRGQETDATIHDDDFPAVWRKVLKAAYYFRIPEYQYPQACRLDPDNYLRFLEGALGRLET